MAGLTVCLAPGFDETITRTSRPVRTSVRTTETTRGVSWGPAGAAGAALSAIRPHEIMLARTAIRTIVSEQKRMLLFYPIITGFLQSATWCLLGSQRTAML